MGQIACYLTKAQFNDTNFIQSLQIVSEHLLANGACVFFKKYSQEGALHLANIGSWTKTGKLDLPTLGCKEVPDSVWLALENREITPCGDFLSSASATGSGLLLLPIFLREHLFGFIALRGVSLDWSTLHVEVFLKAVIAIYELWISKLNEAKKFDDLIESLPSPTFVIDLNGAATVWNSAVEQMTGWSASRILGKGNYEHALPFYGIRRPTGCNLILNPNPKWEATYSSFQKNGDSLFVQIFAPNLPGGGAFLTGTTKVMRDINGRICSVIHIMGDVTRQRLIESKLKSSESLFQTITDCAGLGIGLFGRDEVLYNNAKFKDLLGVSEREANIEDLLEATQTENKEVVRQRLDMMFAGKGTGPLRLDLKVKRGEGDRYYSSYAQMLDYDGKPTICFLLDDITEQKELAERARVNELKMYHEGRLTSLGIMAAGIAHELNQPLNTIRVITDGLLFGRDENWPLDADEVYETMEMISNQTLRMSDVIQNIRDFSRGDRDQSLVTVNVNDAVHNVLKMIGRQFEVHDIIICKDLAKSVPNVQANLNRVEQVIMNLMVNARQALDGCERDKKIVWISTGTKGRAVYIRVADNATGIRSEIMDRVFDPFFTTKEVGQGTGLGLTISRSIIREFGGDIQLSNNEQGGATLVIHLPYHGGSLEYSNNR
jgi:PAS domain S-box-containing protein